MFVFVFVRPIRQKFLAFAIKLPDFNNLLVKYLCIKLESTWLNNGITLDKHSGNAIHSRVFYARMEVIMCEMLKATDKHIF